MNKLKQLINLKMPRKYDTGIQISVLILLLIGFVTVSSTSVGESSKDSLIVVKTIVKQLIFITVSYLCMTNFARRFMAAYRKNKDKFDKKIGITGVVIVIMLVACLLFPGANGSKAWIYIPLINVSLQPSEFAKIYMIVLCGLVANFFYTYRKKNHKNVTAKQYLLIPGVFLTLFFMIILLLQKDFGSAVVLLLICMTMILIPSNPCLKKVQKLVKYSLVIIALLVGFLFFTKPGISIVESAGGYKAARVVNAANPFKNQYGSGYNMIYSLYAIASGGVTGLGFGGSEQKFGYLPEAETDFILAVTLEEWGIFAFAAIVICYLMIIYRLYYWSKKARDADGYKVILMGCATYLAIHFVFNVGGISGLIPLTGVPLLFISSGGSSMLAIMIIIGICQSVISHIRLQNESYVKKYRMRRGR